MIGFLLSVYSNVSHKITRLLELSAAMIAYVPLHVVLVHSGLGQVFLAAVRHHDLHGLDGL